MPHTDIKEIVDDAVTELIFADIFELLLLDSTKHTSGDELFKEMRKLIVDKVNLNS